MCHLSHGSNLCLKSENLLLYTKAAATSVVSGTQLVSNSYLENFSIKDCASGVKFIPNDMINVSVASFYTSSMGAAR